MKNKKKKGPLLAIIFVMLCVVFVGFDWDALANVRNVDILKIFACGMLTGVLILTIKDILLEWKNG